MSADRTPEQQALYDALTQVIEPSMIDFVSVCDGIAKADLILSSTADPNRDEILARAKRTLEKADGVKSATVGISIKTPAAKGAFAKGAPQAAPQPTAPVAPKAQVPGIKHIIAVSSGKGGVGKTSVSVNLACALQQAGNKVGILDADIYGPNVPIMMGLRQAKLDSENNRLIAPENHGVKVVSMAFLIKEDQPVVWRGPMLDKVIRQFLTDTNWGELDYLIVDLPPGTGDAQLTTIQAMPVTGAVIVTTPQDVAIHDSRKGLAMFISGKVPVLGVIENMSYFRADDGKEYEIFGRGGGRKAAEELKLAFLGEIPIIPQQREDADAGKPIVVSQPDSEQAEIFKGIAKQIATSVNNLNRETVGV